VITYRLKERCESLPPHWKIEAYEEDGARPVHDFIKNELEPAERGRLTARLEMLSDKGLGAGSDLLHKISRGKRDDPRRKLWELRLPNSKNNPRFLLMATGDKTLVLLHGFKKVGRSNDRIPESEIRTALRRMHRFLERQEDDE